MKIVTVETLQGEKYEEMGIVSGSTIQSKNFVSDFGQGLKSIVGGELHSYTDMMEKARNKATQRMVDEAVRIGADAIVGVRYATAPEAIPFRRLVGTLPLIPAPGCPALRPAEAVDGSQDRFAVLPASLQAAPAHRITFQAQAVHEVDPRPVVRLIPGSPAFPIRSRFVQNPEQAFPVQLLPVQAIHAVSVVYDVPEVEIPVFFVQTHVGRGNVASGEAQAPGVLVGAVDQSFTDPPAPVGLADKNGGDPGEKLRQGIVVRF